LVFSDEFDGPHLDTRKWDTQYWTGRTAPPELEYYAPDAFEFGAGTLRLKAERRHMGQMSYTSGMISSYRKFDLTYGYVELRGKIPEGRGLWPAFWLLTYGEQPPFEIDVMEILGHEPQRIYTTMHYRDASGANHDDGNDYVGADFSADFHLFAVEWTPDVIIWYIDGVERYRVTEHVPQQPMYIIANLAIGGDWPGNPDATTRFPAYFEIDYIRAYQH
jgi:beta-glucanase (GH16 family)